MDTDPLVSSNDNDEHVFAWLAHDSAPPAERHPEDADRPANGSTSRSTRVLPMPTHARLDPLTVQGVINRVLVLVFCLIAVGATYEAVHVVSSSRVPRSTAVVPSLLPSTTALPKVAAVVAPKQTQTTHAPATTAPPLTAPATTVPVTTPRTTPRGTTPPATFPHTVVPRTTPHTTPQTIQVPATTPTTTPSGPSDTVVVPFK